MAPFYYSLLMLKSVSEGHLKKLQNGIDIWVLLYFKPGQVLKVKNRFFRCIF